MTDVNTQMEMEAASEDMALKQEPCDFIFHLIKEEVKDELEDCEPASSSANTYDYKLQVKEEITIEPLPIATTLDDTGSFTGTQSLFLAMPKAKEDCCHSSQDNANYRMINTTELETRINFPCDFHDQEYIKQSNCGSGSAPCVKKRVHNIQKNSVGDDPVYICAICGAKFKKSRLKEHIFLHIANKHFKCSLCSAKFRYKSSLVIHTRVHNGEKPFTCSVCSAKFSQKCHLVSHTRTHTGEKPFTCSVCSAKFSHKSNLVIHTRIHTGEKPFTCSVCSAKFSHKSHLVSHTRTHTREKPFTCSVCSAKFSDKSNLVSHTRTHKGEIPFT